MPSFPEKSFHTIYNEGKETAIFDFLKKNPAKDSEEIKDRSEFLYERAIDNIKLGTFLSQKEQADLLDAFTGNFPFKGMPFQIALRFYLSQVSPPSEQGNIKRILDAFSKHFYQENKDQLGFQFSNEKDIEQVALSTYQLITEVGNPNIKNPMTKEEFIKKNLPLIKKDLKGNISYMKNIYQDIVKYPLYQETESPKLRWSTLIEALKKEPIEKAYLHAKTLKVPVLGKMHSFQKSSRPILIQNLQNFITALEKAPNEEKPKLAEDLYLFITDSRMALKKESKLLGKSRLEKVLKDLEKKITPYTAAYQNKKRKEAFSNKQKGFYDLIQYYWAQSLKDKKNAPFIKIALLNTLKRTPPEVLGYQTKDYQTLFSEALNKKDLYAASLLAQHMKLEDLEANITQAFTPLQQAIMFKSTLSPTTQKPLIRKTNEVINMLLQRLPGEAIDETGLRIKGRGDNKSLKVLSAFIEEQQKGLHQGKKGPAILRSPPLSKKSYPSYSKDSARDPKPLLPPKLDYATKKQYLKKEGDKKAMLFQNPSNHPKLPVPPKPKNLLQLSYETSLRSQQKEGSLYIRLAQFAEEAADKLKNFKTWSEKGGYIRRTQKGITPITIQDALKEIYTQKKISHTLPVSLPKENPFGKLVFRYNQPDATVKMLEHAAKVLKENPSSEKLKELQKEFKTYFHNEKENPFDQMRQGAHKPRPQKG